jgi:hypothetical protein
MEVDITSIHTQLGNVFAVRKRLATEANRFEPVRRHSHFLDLVARE